MMSSSLLCVQRTNDNSVVSKCSMVNMGYFDDPFIGCFVSKCSRRAPLINRGYYVRTKAIEMAVELFLNSCKTFDCSLKQIISLGAGYDSLYFRIAAKKQVDIRQMVLIEVDFESVVRCKLKIICSEEKLCDMLTDYPALKNCENNTSSCIVLDTPQYKLLGFDLCDLQKLNSSLIESRVDFTKPTLFLSECAITYMPTNESNDLIRWIATNFPNSMLAVYEQIVPGDAFGRIMCGHFSNLNATLCSIHCYPDVDSQKERYENLGWSSCDVLDMNTFVEKMLPAEEMTRINELEMFEEFEEFHAKCSHYALAIAVNGPMKVGRFPVPLPPVVPLRSSEDISGVLEVEDHGIVNRFGHRSECIKNLIITIGGFGVSRKGGHSRQLDICITSRCHAKDYFMPVEETKIQAPSLERMFHSLSRLAHNRLLMIGGRRSPKEHQSDIALLECTSRVDFSSACVEDLKSHVPMSVTITAVRCETEGHDIRWRHSATVIHIDGAEAVFIFGGRNAMSPALGDSHVLFIPTWEWKQMISNEHDSSMHPCARHSHSACHWNSRVVVSGGLDTNQRPLDSVHIFDYEKQRWTRLQTTSAVVPRYSHTSHTWKNKLFLLGGVNVASAADPPGIGIIGLTCGDVCEVAFPNTPKPFLFNKHSSVLDEEAEEIFVLGGGGTCFSFGTHLNQSAFVVRLKDVESSVPFSDCSANKCTSGLMLS